MANSSASFAENSVVDFLVPEASDLDIIEALGSSESSRNVDDTVLITTIPQRRLLYFDEKIDLYVVLRTPYIDDEISIKATIASLNIALEAHAVSSPTPEENQRVQGQVRDVIWSGKVDVTEDPIIVVEQSEDDDDAEQTVLLIWKVKAFLSRPRVRLQAPAIIFKLSASLRPVKTQQDLSEQYLTSGAPLPASIFGSLLGASTFDTSPVARTAKPTRGSRTEVLPLKIVSRRAFQAIPAVSSRIRYHRLGMSVGIPAVVASLELEIPSFAQHVIQIDKISLRLAGGTVEDLHNEHLLKLPMKCQPQDIICTLHSLKQSTPASEVPLSPHTVTVKILAKALVSSSCQPRIEIQWKSSVDFATAINPNFKPPQSLQRTNRPISLPNPAALPGRRDPSPQTSSELYGIAPTISTSLGITTSFTAPSNPIYLGEPFPWSVFIVNNSPHPRRISLSMISRSHKLHTKGHRSTGSNSSDTNLTNRESAVADAFLPDSVLHALIKAQATEPVDLICLNADLKIGPLAPGACFDAEMTLLPLAKGWLRVEGVRIVDADSGEAVDVGGGELPDVWVEEKEKGWEGVEREEDQLDRNGI